LIFQNLLKKVEIDGCMNYKLNIKTNRLIQKSMNLTFVFSCLASFLLSVNLPNYTLINGRFEKALYRCKIFDFVLDSEIKEDKKDTTIALKKLQIEDIVITIHNFPAYTYELPPPMIQIYRWLNQMGCTQENDYNIEPISRGGFIGLKVEAVSDDNALIAVAMQVDDEYKKDKLSASKAFEESISPYTIKAIGPKCQIDRHRSSILEIMQSFEITMEFFS
jgi:hypothetical protein